MPDVTREQALAAARLVYGPGACVDELPDGLGWQAWAIDVGLPMAGTWPRSGSTLRELVDEMAREYASGCQREAEPWFAAGGRCVGRAETEVDDAILPVLARRLMRLHVWVSCAEGRVYRAAGLPAPRPSDAPSEQDR